MKIRSLFASPAFLAGNHHVQAAPHAAVNEPTFPTLEGLSMGFDVGVELLFSAPAGTPCPTAAGLDQGSTRTVDAHRPVG